MQQVPSLASQWSPAAAVFIVMIAIQSIMTVLQKRWNDANARKISLLEIEIEKCTKEREEQDKKLLSVFTELETMRKIMPTEVREGIKLLVTEAQKQTAMLEGWGNSPFRYVRELCTLTQEQIARLLVKAEKHGKSIDDIARVLKIRGAKNVDEVVAKVRKKKEK